MNFNQYVMPLYQNTFDNFVKTTDFQIEINSQKKILIKNKGLDKKYATEDLIYFFLITHSYKNGPKCLAPDSEQCVIMGNIEARIPLKDYKQIYPTIIIELPEGYQTYLKNKYNSKPATAAMFHWEQNTLLCGVFFGTRNPVVTMYIAPSYSEHTIEDSIVLSHKFKQDTDPDRMMSVDVLRMCTNLNLYVVHYGHEHRGYKNIKQHRFYERKRPLEAKLDIEYFSLKQNIKLYRRETYKEGDGNSTHASPKPHFRRGHMRNQHYKEGTKLIFIMPTFVCSEKFRGNLSDTQANYDL